MTGKDTQTGAATKAEDLTGLEELSNEYANWRYAVSPTAGDRTYNTQDVKHSFPDVLMQLCGQAEGQAFNEISGFERRGLSASSGSDQMGGLPLTTR